jgi:Cu/Ag efflux pump CusA
LQENPKDAIPDISENQVIVSTEWMGRSPQDVEDQITYPLAHADAGHSARRGRAHHERLRHVAHLRRL